MNERSIATDLHPPEIDSQLDSIFFSVCVLLVETLNGPHPTLPRVVVVDWEK